jgi:hypothetical protein
MVEALDRVASDV